VRAVYSVPVRLDPKAHTTAGVIAGSATDIIEQLYSFIELGFTGFDLLPSRDQIRAVAEDVVPALRELPLFAHGSLKAAAEPAPAAT
jgi:alkanesulfonate monooxygenase SsuD/methylene tetrahydromethanopterin reductase-like flavin-dependent oxidoreductase (luciferase family)